MDLGSWAPLMLGFEVVFATRGGSFGGIGRKPIRELTDMGYGFKTKLCDLWETRPFMSCRSGNFEAESSGSSGRKCKQGSLLY